MLHRIGTVLVVLLAWAWVGPEAWAAKVGPEFRVNSFTLYSQAYPSVAGLGNGGFVVTWDSVLQDGSGYGVYGQRYGATGARAGAEFRVNTTTAGQQQNPSVAGLDGGGFVITWTASGQDGPGDLGGIYGQRYSAAGARAGGQFRVNTTRAGLQDSPSVAGLSSGGFAVTWTSEVGDGSLKGVYGQRYSATGARAGGEFRVNTHTVGNQYAPSIAGLTQDRFVVTWTSVFQDGSGLSVYGQRYSAGGARAGGEFRVNTRTADSQDSPSVAGLGSGGFAVTWMSELQDGSEYGVYGQRYSPAGTRAGAEFRVNLYRTNDQYSPSVAGLGDGGFVVAWTSEAQDGSWLGVYAQRYGALGGRIGGEFKVNTYTTINQHFPSVAGLGDGGFVAVWTSSDHQDGSGDGVYGQRYSP